MNESAKTKIELVINTLNSINVKGKDNLSFLLGSIQTLEALLREEKDGAANA